MSRAIATIIFRTFSACSASRERKRIFSSLVSPSTSEATSSPNSARTSSRVAGVSSTTSWSRAAWSVVRSMPRSARIVATDTGCSMNSSPESRFWPRWAASENS